jgi:hypothetical protein
VVTDVHAGTDIRFDRAGEAAALTGGVHDSNIDGA